MIAVQEADQKKRPRIIGNAARKRGPHLRVGSRLTGWRELKSLPPGSSIRARCAACHNLVTEHSIGPHLGGVIGRRAGGVAGFIFTAAMSALDIVWTQENLAEYIVDPARFAPGTTMAGVGVTDEEARLIIEFLAANQ